MTESQPLRLFIAVELPEAWARVLAAAQTRLRQRLETPEAPGLRWVKPEGIHLTLKFLGSVAPDRLPDLESAVAAPVPAAPNLRLGLGDLGVFASGRRVRVLWAGLKGDVGPLVLLAGAIDAACATLGFEPERRPLAPHLTLARVPEGATLLTDGLAPHLRGVDLTGAPPLLVDRVSLIRSNLGPGGARYERLHTWPG